MGKCYQWRAHGQCSKGDSCCFSHDKIASGNSGSGQRRKDDRLLPHQIRRQRLTVKKATEMNALTKEFRFCADTKIVFFEKKTTSFWHLPVCQNFRSESGCTYGDKCRLRHVEAEEKPSKKSKKGGAKGTVALLKRACLRREVPIDHEAHGQRGSGRSRRAGAPISAQESRPLSFGGMRTQRPKRTARRTLVSTLRPSAERT